jgi:site-specific recombinase XerD
MLERTLLGEQQVGMHVIQRILGHAPVTTTRIYTDPADSLTREAAIRSEGCGGADGD